jgi:hypothetical protein
MRFQFLSNISNIVLSNVFCKGLSNPSNIQLVTLDILPNLQVATLQALSNTTPNASVVNGSQLLIGNAADYNYSLIFTSNNAIKLNIDGLT